MSDDERYNEAWGVVFMYEDSLSWCICACYCLYGSLLSSCYKYPQVLIVVTLVRELVRSELVIERLVGCNG